MCFSKGNISLYAIIIDRCLKCFAFFRFIYDQISFCFSKENCRYKIKGFFIYFSPLLQTKKKNNQKIHKST